MYVLFAMYVMYMYMSGWPLVRVQRSMPKIGGTRFGTS